ncbi:hypothetical protein HMPREF0670_02351 [Prevotella sp. oral taxon 317 str. F0108]|nr:hypothetical protein HMPREF0670_02351 [Prevotella sp. oral taxon 317 str. F0108]
MLKGVPGKISQETCKPTSRAEQAKQPGKARQNQPLANLA